MLVQIIGETITTIKLASQESWKQIFFDATTCCQVPFQAVIIGLMTNENKLDPVVVSSCILMKDELAEKTVDSIVNKVRMFVVRMLLMHMINFIHLS